MDNITSDNIRQINTLLDNRIRYLRLLLKLLQDFIKNLENFTSQEISANAAAQTEALRKIKDIDQAYQKLMAQQKQDNTDKGNPTSLSVISDTQEIINLSEKHKEEQELTQEIINLSGQALTKAQSQSGELKNKLRDINRQNRIIDSYHSNMNNPGILLDYKEGEKK